MGLVYGVGLNDLNRVGRGKNGHGLVKDDLYYIYRIWSNMLERCYSKHYHKRYNTYVDCEVDLEWLTFSNFYEWTLQQNWEGKQLDKDLKIKGNRVYSKNTCLYLDRRVNNFLIDRERKDNDLPVGVYFDKSNNKYKAHISDPVIHKRKTLGYFSTPELAYKAWLDEKIRLASKLADTLDDIVVADLLRKYFQ